MFKFNKNKIETPVEEQVIEPKRKLQVHEKIIVGVVLTLILGMAGAALASNLGPSNSLDDLKVAFEKQVDLMESNEENRVKAKKQEVEVCRMIEIGMAKVKLVDHYSDKAPQTWEDLDRLESKAQGMGLTCDSVF